MQSLANTQLVASACQVKVIPGVCMQGGPISNVPSQQPQSTQQQPPQQQHDQPHGGGGSDRWNGQAGDRWGGGGGDNARPRWGGPGDFWSPAKRYVDAASSVTRMLSADAVLEQLSAENLGCIHTVPQMVSSATPGVLGVH